jgi:hypothetical protein
LSRAAVVYLGSVRLKDGKVEVLPLFDFLQQLYAGKLLG